MIHVVVAISSLRLISQPKMGHGVPGRQALGTVEIDTEISEIIITSRIKVLIKIEQTRDYVPYPYSQL